MKPVRQLLSEEIIEDLASRSNLRFGKTLLKNEAVNIIKENAFNIYAKVKHSNKQELETTISSTSKGLRWKCECTAKKEYFCEHVAAVALNAIASKSPEQ